MFTKVIFDVILYSAWESIGLGLCDGLLVLASFNTSSVRTCVNQYLVILGREEEGAPRCVPPPLSRLPDLAFLANVYTRAARGYPDPQARESDLNCDQYNFGYSPGDPTYKAT